MGRSTIFSALDLKAGFHNVPLEEGSKQYCGIITQDGVYVWERMAFGFLGAPATFQAIVEDIISRIPGGVRAAIYIDDIHPHGVDIKDVWKDTKACVGALVDAGFMINLSKCHFLVADVVVLGFGLFQQEYQLGKKALSKLLGVTIPRSLKELQAVMGKLNFASKFIPGYNRLSKPLKQLMSHAGGDQWTAEHTASLNALLRLAAAKLKLTVADWG